MDDAFLKFEEARDQKKNNVKEGFFPFVSEELLTQKPNRF